MRIRTWSILAATLLAWMAMTVGTSRLTWKVLTAQVLLGPQPNFIPRSPLLLLKYVLDGHSVLDTLGNGVLWNLSFHAYTLPFASPISRWTLGLLAALFQVAILVFATRWSWRNRRLAPHILAATKVSIVESGAIPLTSR